jgi:hypothetical protein
MTTGRASLALFALPLIAFAPPAAAQLNAFFAGDTTRVCVQSGAGFDANLALLGSAKINSAVVVSQLFFRPDGTGTISKSNLRIAHNATGTGATPAVEHTGTCSFTYTFDPAASKVKATGMICDSVDLTGPEAGQTTHTTDVHGEWVLLEGGTKLVHVSTAPSVEHRQNLTTGETSQRICHRDGVFVLRGPAQAN